MKATKYDEYMACGRAEEGKAGDDLPDDLASEEQRPRAADSVEERPEEEEEEKGPRPEGRYRLKEPGP